MVHNSSHQSFSLRIRVWHSNTRTCVRLLGPCFKTGRLKPFRQHPLRNSKAIRTRQIPIAVNMLSVKGHRKVTQASCKRSKPQSPTLFLNRPCWKSAQTKALSSAENWCWLDSEKTTVTCNSFISEPILVSIVSFLTISRTFNSLFKVLFIFPSRYLFAIGLLPIFSFRWNLPPILSCIPKQLDS